MIEPARRIFISYSTKDGSGTAAKLRNDLETEHFSVWQDIVALEGGRDWWSQIENALKSKAPVRSSLTVAVLAGDELPEWVGGIARIAQVSRRHRAPLSAGTADIQDAAQTIRRKPRTRW